MHSSEIIEKCKSLRRKGFSLGDIVKKTGLPKTTVYYHIRDITLSPADKKKIREKGKERARQYIRKHVKGKCRGSITVSRPEGWSNELLLLTAHLIFDGEITNGCIYGNRNLVLINRVKKLTENIFNLEPSSQKYCEESGVHEVSYYYVELANYFQKKAVQIQDYIKEASLKEKRIFLRAFFDDEGCMLYDKKQNSRKVRGYQNNKDLLLLIKKLLQDLNIESRLEKGSTWEVVVSKKENLIKFHNKINFSKRVYINPNRKNSLWEKKFQKRDLLDMAINSYVR